MSSVARLLLMLFFLGYCAESQALFRTYLASTGDDANPCTRPAPCRLLPAAIAAVDRGGEVWILDSANFNTGTVTIDKGVSILAMPGVVASVVGNADPAIVINVAVDGVKLRNLQLRRLPGGSTGISVLHVAHLLLEGVSMEDFTTGLRVTGNARVAIKDSLFRANATGIQLLQSDQAAFLWLAIDGTSMLENDLALIATTAGITGLMSISIDRSVVNGPTQNGALVFRQTVPNAAPLKASVVRSNIIGRDVTTDFGVYADGSNTFVTISDCHFSGFPARFATAWDSGNGVGILKTFGNNTFSEGAALGRINFAPQ